ncbi:hypothetical protein [Aliiglaciecola sp. LCG003]|uniref:hypothetical protein n=1 Tax=Aliiglaciecola sp. LCG003 TaxID=3053655 RepID=UPI0025725F8C|nr:hypothetical protein [Aliiglaciecola sp. LCG003]WJG10367.1 hypothetical protein QR722_04835 [Aliiglaciecola sp. LCG003]
MEKYLYLTWPEWVDAWVNGGKIPLNPASVYKRMDRDGIYTPDENLIYESTHPIDQMNPAIYVANNVQNVTVGASVFECGNVRQEFPANYIKDFYQGDGVILSLCNRKSNSIAERLRKRAAVKIFNVAYLKAVIDEQLGKKSIAKPCEYTSSHNRNHFLKSVADQWQDEYRFFWDHQERVEVELPKGMAKRIKIKV